MSDSTSASQQQIRVLVASIAGSLLQHITQVIEQQSDMYLLGQVQDRIELLLVAEHADVVVLGAPQLDIPPGICSHLLNEYPGLKILMVSTTGGEMMIYWRALQQLQLNIESSPDLQVAIREAFALTV